MKGRLLWLPRVLADAGLKVSTVDGWHDRGKPTMWSRPGIVAHHTASSRYAGGSPSLGIVTHGRSDLPGPLAQLLLSRNGVYYVVASGKANHAGTGDYHGLKYNSSVIGIEAENDGRGEPWNPEQYDAYVRGCAALLKHVNRTTYYLCGHKEWAPGRKPDPRGIDMDTFRSHVASAMAGRWQSIPGGGGDAIMMKKGDDGAKVGVAQKALMAWARKAGLITSATKPNSQGSTWEKALHWGIDEDFGGTTEEMVQAFQKAHDLTVTGAIDGTTGWLLGRYAAVVDLPASGGNVDLAALDKRYAPKAHGHDVAPHTHDGRYAPKDHGHKSIILEAR